MTRLWAEGLRSVSRTLGVGENELRHLDRRVAKIGEATQGRRRGVARADVARDRLTRDPAGGRRAPHDEAVLLEIVALVEIHDDLPRRSERRIEEAAAVQHPHGLAHHRLRAASTSHSETDDIPPGQPMQHVCGVLELRAVAVRGDHPVALPFRVGVAQQRNVITRHRAGLRGLREHLGDIGEMRVQVEREMRLDETEDKEARGDVGHRERDDHQCRVRERGLETGSHAGVLAECARSVYWRPCLSRKRTRRSRPRRVRF